MELITISKDNFCGLPIVTRKGNVLIRLDTTRERPFIVMSKTTYNKLSQIKDYTVTGAVEEVVGDEAYKTVQQSGVSNTPMRVFKSLKF